MARVGVRYKKTERVGINAVNTIVTDDLGWIFREQSVADMGIDAHIEEVDEGGFPTGKLIGVQIKSGASHVKRAGKKKADRKLVYYGSMTHFEYWLSHSLPVVLIVHIPNEATYWQVVNSATAKKTGKRFKLEIPVKNVLGRDTKDRLEEVFQGTPEQQKENRLAADESLMRFIADGGKVAVEMEDWVNKSLGRTPVNIYRVERGVNVLDKAYGLMYTGYTIKQVARRLFPWATIQIDEEFYEEHAPEEDEIDALSRAVDAEHDIYREPLTADDIRPYDEVGGEVDSYRLQLHLNEIGRAFLTLSDYKRIPDDTWAKRDDDEGDEENVDLIIPEDDSDD